MFRQVQLVQRQLSVESELISTGCRWGLKERGLTREGLPIDASGEDRDSRTRASRQLSHLGHPEPALRQTAQRSPGRLWRNRPVRNAQSRSFRHPMSAPESCRSAMKFDHWRQMEREGLGLVESGQAGFARQCRRTVVPQDANFAQSLAVATTTFDGIRTSNFAASPVAGISILPPT